MEEKRKPRTFIREDSSLLEHGRIPPQAVEAEEAVLGAMLMNGNIIAEVSAFLTPEMFYKEDHQLICKAIFSLFAKGENADLVSLSNELKSQGNLEQAGGMYAVAQLTNRVVGGASAMQHTRIILEMHLRRSIIAKAADASVRAYDPSIDVFQSLDSLSSEILKLGGFSTSPIESLAVIGLRRISELANQKRQELLGLDTGWRDINTITLGWRKNMIIILAARPGMGKTSFMLQAAYNLAIKNIPVGIFSLEMGKDELFDRILSIDSGINHRAIQTMNLLPSEYNTFDVSCKAVRKLPIYIDDTGGLSIMRLRAKAIRMVREYNIRMLFVDYIQLMTSEESSDNRTQELGKISRGLKNLSKELGIPIMPLSQLNRKVEDRAGNRPNMADLRESGDIEQDADLVCFLFRPSHYKQKTPDGSQVDPRLTEFIIAKNRHGAIDTPLLTWNASRMSFTDWIEESPPHPDSFTERDIVPF